MGMPGILRSDAPAVELRNEQPAAFAPLNAGLVE
jgi:hypothetical protein